MAYRFTNTDKWGDAWFSELRPIEKLLFNYLCDNCDIAGFIEITIKKWAMDIGTDKAQIEGALKGLARGLIYSNTNDCVFIKNFLKHQKNLPINSNNKAHLGIIYRFESYKNKFGFVDYKEFIEGACKGLQSPIGIGIGNDVGSDIGTNNSKRFDFKKQLISLGISEQIASDWMKVRKDKGASNTETAFNAIKKQIETSGISANECIKIAVERSWQGFKSEWLKNIAGYSTTQTTQTSIDQDAKMCIYMILEKEVHAPWSQYQIDLKQRGKDVYFIRYE